MDNEFLKELYEKSELYADLSALEDTAGGKKLVGALMKDVVNTVDRIAFNYRSMTLTEFIECGASLGAKINIVRAITHSKDDKQRVLNDIEEALKK